MLIRIPHNLYYPPSLFKELGGVRLLLGGLLRGAEDVAQVEAARDADLRCKM